MASVFKQQYTAKDPKTGKRVTRKSKHWYIEYREHDGTRKRVRGFTDKKDTMQLAVRLEHEADLVAAGMGDRFKKHRKRPLMEHLEEFKASLKAKGTTEKHVDLVYTRARKIVQGCQFATWMDISASRIEAYLAQERRDETVEGPPKPGETEPTKEVIKGMSAQTFNFYIQAIKQFCRWMVLDQRAEASPVEHLRKISTKTDRRHDRRSLEPYEIQALLKAAVGGPEYFGMEGYERALLYRLTIETGLRASELRSLRVSSFDLEGCVVTVQAAYCKNRQKAAIPLKRETAELLREFFVGKMPGVKAFRMPGENRLVTMLRKDLDAAEITYKDTDGRFVDFHALRHTAGSLLAASGAHPKVAQSIMRHSDINLTMSRYSHVLSGQESAAVENLPSFSLEAEEMRATGTDGSSSGMAVSEDGGGAYRGAYRELTEPVDSGLDRAALSGSENAEGDEFADSEVDVCNAFVDAELGAEDAPLALVVSGDFGTEEEGFEPPVPFGTAVFKTATLSHSVTPPA